MRLATVRSTVIPIGIGCLVVPVGEGVSMGGRDASVEAILTTPVAGTDDLGAWDGLWGTAGVHYRWAVTR